ncbi:hypothetical protein ONA91_39885 [Micromonospora sp. DR5-3]|uniref:hypothetical protein n=1 Tax=Micromonospora sp. DR5-3 TaxID=2992129 RepID=UPI00222FCC22|nr:hypothetical protein [Micromonospora sp. DR5-3]MCW3820611.1 hypothetical protein [Micromonospora sp. DR5-3]
MKGILTEAAVLRKSVRASNFTRFTADRAARQPGATSSWQSPEGSSPLRPLPYSARPPVWSPVPARPHPDICTSGPSPSYGFYNQNDTSDLLRVLANPTGAVPSGKCLDMWYDWSREGGHYDARMARSCRPAYQRER